MAISIEKVESVRQKAVFVQVPYLLHRAEEGWIPPLRMMEKNYLNPKKNRHFSHSEVICFLAWRDGQPAGRVMGIVNRELEEVEKEKQARFCSFECIDDQETACRLLAAVEGWAKAQGLNRLVGPLGFSNQDPQGFIVEGFQERPSINTIHNFQYLPLLMEKAGYEKEVDYVTYKVPIPDRAPDLYYTLAPRVLKRNQVSLKGFSRKSQARPYLPKMLRLMNETYRGIYGFVPLSEEGISRAVRNYSRIFTPEFFKILEDGQGEPIAFILGIRDITPGIRAAGGRLFPLGYFKIKRFQARTNRLDLLLGAVKQEYRGRGLDILMALSMLKSAQEAGMQYADSHHELESNTLVQAEMKRMGGFIYKRHRVYRKEL